MLQAMFGNQRSKQTFLSHCYPTTTTTTTHATGKPAHEATITSSACRLPTWLFLPTYTDYDRRHGCMHGHYLSEPSPHGGSLVASMEPKAALSLMPAIRLPTASFYYHDYRFSVHVHPEPRSMHNPCSHPHVT